VPTEETKLLEEVEDVDEVGRRLLEYVCMVGSVSVYVDLLAYLCCMFPSIPPPSLLACHHVTISTPGLLCM
jgi:hypothetical protein